MAETKITAILLDDSLIDREIGKLACAMAEIPCTTYSNAKDFLKHWEEHYGAILDYSMADKNGVDVAKLVLAKAPDYPIIFRSNYPQGSKAHNDMIKLGHVMSKDMTHTAIDLLKEFKEQMHKYYALKHIEKKN